MMATAEILIHTDELPGNRRTYRYEWQGPRGAPVWINEYLMEDSATLPWPLRKIQGEFDWSRSASLYLRTDTATWWLTALRHWLRRRWEWLAARLIMTAMVWGLAYVPEAESPRWDHLGKRRPAWR